MSTNPTAFIGASAYSSDFESVIARAVAIRSLGLSALNTGKANILAQGQAVSGLDSVFSSLQNAVTAITTSIGVASLTSTVSTSGFVLPALAAGALPGTYGVEVTNLGGATNTLSKNAQILVTDPSMQNISAGADFTLTVNGVDTTITPTGTSVLSEKYVA